MQPEPHSASRLEGFSDAVFGFALTLLVVQLEVPQTGVALKLLILGSVPFAVTFAMVCYIWWEHNRFFRLCGLQDAWTAFLNSVLLFVVLFYVYPLKFLATALISPAVGLPGKASLEDGRFVMTVYSIGVVLIFGLFVLLYRHAWNLRQELGLTASSGLSLRYKMRAHVLTTSLGLVSVLLSLVLSPRWLWVAGVLYGLMGPLHSWNGLVARAAHRRLAAAAAEALAEGAVPEGTKGRPETTPSSLSGNRGPGVGVR